VREAQLEAQEIVAPAERFGALPDQGLNGDLQ